MPKNLHTHPNFTAINCAKSGTSRAGSSANDFTQLGHRKFFGTKLKTESELEISVLVDLFFLINLFFLVDFLHEAALDVPDFAQFMAGKFGCVCRFFGTEKSIHIYVDVCLK